MNRASSGLLLGGSGQRSASFPANAGRRGLQQSVEALRLAGDKRGEAGHRVGMQGLADAEVAVYAEVKLLVSAAFQALPAA